MDSPTGVAFLLRDGTEICAGDFSLYPIDVGVVRAGTYSTELDYIFNAMVTSYIVGLVG